MNRILPVFLISLLISVFAGSAGASEKDVRNLQQNRDRLKNGYFAVCMAGSVPETTLRAASVLSRIATFRRNGSNVAPLETQKIPFYLYIFDGDGVLHLKDFWKGHHQTFLADRKNRKLLERPVSLFDPEVKKKLLATVRTAMDRFERCDLLAVCVDHEGSLTSFSTPIDFDYSEHCLSRFRAWLKTRYPSIADLNKVWRTSFKSFEEVDPPTTDAVYLANKSVYPFMKLEGWAEFHVFLDEFFIDLNHELIAEARKATPEAPLSVTVSAVPSAFGGWDYAHLLEDDKLDVIETYKFPGAKGMVRGLTGGRTFNFSSHYGTVDTHIIKLWLDFFQGERGTFLGLRTSKVFPKGKVGAASALHKPYFDKMIQIAPMADPATVFSGDVSLIYSQPSVRTYWMYDMQIDKLTWPRRGSKYEIKHNTYQQVLGGWQAVLGELGIHPHFESYRHLKQGRFKHGTPKVLIANRLIAASDALLKTLKAYVEDGGTLVIDESFALYDERGSIRGPDPIPFTTAKRGKEFKLSAIAGSPTEEQAARAEPQTFAVGKGRVILLNATVAGYTTLDADARRKAIRSRITGILAKYAKDLPFVFDPVSDVDLFVFTTQGNHLLAACETKPREDRREIGLRITDPKKWKAIDPISGKEASASLKLPKVGPALLKLKASSD